MLIKTFFDKWIHIQAIAKECTESAEVISGIDSGWKKKYHIKSKNFLGHSDIAPNRKKDPGEKFPWKYFANQKIGIWYSLSKKSIKLRNIEVSMKEKKFFYSCLKKIGYCLKKNSKHPKFIIKAFQSRFRPKIINGKIDKECLEIAKNLIKRGLN